MCVIVDGGDKVTLDDGCIADSSGCCYCCYVAFKTIKPSSNTDGIVVVRLSVAMIITLAQPQLVSMIVLCSSKAMKKVNCMRKKVYFKV